MTLVELMIAMVVLLVGITASMAVVAVSMGGNGRNRQQSNSTVVAQMVSEKISSVKANVASPTVTITDCTGTTTTVTTTAGGSSLNTSGDIDFTQAAVSGYQLLYTDCGTSGRQVTYDVRWNITQSTNYVKLLVVSAKMQNAGTALRFFALPVTIRTLVGQGT